MIKPKAIKYEDKRRVAYRRQVVERTLNDGQQDNDDEEEEGDVEEDTVDFVLVAVGRLDLVTDTTASSDTLVITY